MRNARASPAPLSQSISQPDEKGYIAGKGYVLRSGTYAAVVGGVNVDIGGQSYAPLVARDSNPGACASVSAASDEILPTT